MKSTAPFFVTGPVVWRVPIVTAIEFVATRESETNEPNPSAGLLESPMIESEFGSGAARFEMQRSWLEVRTRASWPLGVIVKSWGSLLKFALLSLY